MKWPLPMRAIVEKSRRPLASVNLLVQTKSSRNGEPAGLMLAAPSAGRRVGAKFAGESGSRQFVNQPASQKAKAKNIKVLNPTATKHL